MERQMVSIGGSQPGSPLLQPRAGACSLPTTPFLHSRPSLLASGSVGDVRRASSTANATLPRPLSSGQALESHRGFSDEIKSWEACLQPRRGYPATTVLEQAPVIHHGGRNIAYPGIPASPAVGSAQKRAFSAPPLEPQAERHVERAWREELAALGIQPPTSSPPQNRYEKSWVPMPRSGLASFADRYDGKLTDTLSTALQDRLDSTPYSSVVPPPLPIVGGLARTFGKPFSVDDLPQGKLIGLAPAMTPLEGLDGMINDGLLDNTYILQEASRRKQDIDRAMNVQLREIDIECENTCASIKQMAEHHTRLAESQIENHKRTQIRHIDEQAKHQAFLVSQQAEAEKEHLGFQAYQAIAKGAQSIKARALHRNMQAMEAVQQGAQRAIDDQLQVIQVQMADHSRRRVAEIERDQHQALSFVHFGPSPVPPPIPMVPMIHPAVEAVR